MARKPVFYSFHFDNDVFRVQQVRNMGALDGNEPVSPNEWETVKRKGDAAIEKWIEDNMKYKQCIVVLVGSETANRRWVRHEIVKAWNDERGVIGIYIHNLKCMKTGTTCAKGQNPFDVIKFDDETPLSRYVTCHDPNFWDAYNDIKNNIEHWVDQAIRARR
ncbi:molecular chaperone Tir [Sulfurifustis variabilis]|uniref:Molecular chaperone Tir n=1 Tax=Sulfurifustis variabilis TaxID=1675686 RepID=A0A1B4V7Q6_9GAMM|nr:molecular chaperone Tir [Sulfurifustis variabilis]